MHIVNILFISIAISPKIFIKLIGYADYFLVLNNRENLAAEIILISWGLGEKGQARSV